MSPPWTMTRWGAVDVSKMAMVWAMATPAGPPKVVVCQPALSAPTAARSQDGGQASAGRCPAGCRIWSAGLPRRRPIARAQAGEAAGLLVSHVLHQCTRPAGFPRLLGEQVAGLLHGVMGAAEVAGEPPDGGEAPAGPRAVSMSARSWPKSCW